MLQICMPKIVVTWENMPCHGMMVKFRIYTQKIKEPLVDPTGSIFAVVEGKLLGKLSRDFCVSQIHTLTFYVVQR